MPLICVVIVLLSLSAQAQTQSDSAEFLGEEGRARLAVAELIRLRAELELEKLKEEVSADTEESAEASLREQTLDPQNWRTLGMLFTKRGTAKVRDGSAILQLSADAASGLKVRLDLWEWYHGADIGWQLIGLDSRGAVLRNEKGRAVRVLRAH